MNKSMKKYGLFGSVILCGILLSGCSSTKTVGKTAGTSKIFSQTQKRYPSSLANSKEAIARLGQQHQEWKGTRYRLGGTSKKGVDCSAFTQLTLRDLFGINIPRTTTDQANTGVKVAKSDLKTGDLVFFKTGRGPNGKHVGIYVDNGQFLHASTKGGVIYSDLNSPYWSKTYWQARRF